MTSAFGFRACSQCDRKYKGHRAWNVTAERGEVVGILCPSYQSPAENAEAEINAATLEYATLDDGPDRWKAEDQRVVTPATRLLTIGRG